MVSPDEWLKDVNADRAIELKILEKMTAPRFIRLTYPATTLRQLDKRIAEIFLVYFGDNFQNFRL